MIHLGDDASVGYGVGPAPLVGRGRLGRRRTPITVGAGAFVGAGRRARPGQPDRSLPGDARRAVGAGPWPGDPRRRDLGGLAAAEHETHGRGARSPWRDAGPLPGWRRTARWPPRWPVWSLSRSLAIAMLVPSVCSVWSALLGHRCLAGFAAALLSGPVFVADGLRAGRRSGAASCCGARPSGVHPVRSALGVRKWIADKLLETSLTFTNSLYATLYTVPWLRALGARVGHGRRGLHRRAPRPRPAHARRGELRRRHGQRRRRHLRNGRVLLRRHGVGARAFVGNAALLPAGHRPGRGSLVGVHTVPPPAGVPDGHARGWARRP